MTNPISGLLILSAVFGLLVSMAVMAPAEDSSYSALSVLHISLDGDDPEEAPIDASGILADGWTIYASRQNLYVAENGGWW